MVTDFYKNVFKLLTSISIAQLIPIIITPILTQYFTPEEFGVYGLYVSICSIFGIIALGFTVYDLVGGWDLLNESLSRISVVGQHAPLNQQVLIEQEKALHQAGIDPLSFEAYKRNFFVGRALSLQNGVYDARGKDFNLQVEYQETTAPTKQKLWNCWVAHLRRIVVKGENIALEV